MPKSLVHEVVAESVEYTLKAAAASRSLDNLTVLILGLKNFKLSLKKLYNGMSIEDLKNS